MYDNPINVIYGEIQTKVEKDMENHIFESVQSVGVMVDKDELIKALKYDRKQYENGYLDGKQEFAAYMLGRIAGIEMMSGINLESLKEECIKALNETEKGTFVQVTEEELENIKANICDDYCNKRKEWIGDPDEMIDEVCVNCPLTRL